jgi:hypothetical protein
MANQFWLEAEELANVVNGLHDIRSQVQDIASTTRGSLAAEGTPWQFNGAPAGIQGQIDKIQEAVDSSNPKSVAAVVGHLAVFLDNYAKAMTRQDAGGPGLV